MKQGTQSQCSGTAQRDGGGEGDGGVQDGGTHVHPWLIHADIWQKPPQYCRVIILQLRRRVKFIQSESTLVDAGVGWGGVGNV